MERIRGFTNAKRQFRLVFGKNEELGMLGLDNTPKAIETSDKK